MTNLTCSEFRARGRLLLSGNYWNCFLACLIISVVAGVISYFSTMFNNSMQSVAVASLSMIAVLLINIILLNPLSVNLLKFFILASKNVTDFNSLLYTYSNNLGNVVKVMFIVGLKTFLWSLLFIVPGIVKSFEYMLIPYMLAENPDMDMSRAFELSRTMMRGNKGKAFLLNLSFIGWAILAVLTLGIGTFFLAPYMQATQTEFYIELKRNAKMSGVFTESDMLDLNI